MYVCNCRGLKEQMVRERIAGRDIACPLGVHFGCDTTPRCGRCLVDMARLVKEAPSARAARIAS